MMNQMRKFTNRVTLYEDGCYRWYYDMDMRTNRCLLNVLMKVMGGVMAGICIVTLVLFSQSSRFTPGVAAVIIGSCGGMVLLTWLGYWLAALIMGFNYRVHFEMTEETIALVRKHSTQTMMRGMAVAATIAGLVTAGGGAALRTGAALNSAASSGFTWFTNVRGMKAHPEWDSVNLREFMGGNQIWIPAEDYDFVKEFIWTHIPEKARR